MVNTRYKLNRPYKAQRARTVQYQVALNYYTKINKLGQCGHIVLHS